MAKLNAQDTISGREGRAYIIDNGNIEELFYIKTLTANVEKLKAEVRSVGNRIVQHKTTGLICTGSLTMYYMSPYFRRKLRQYKETGIDFVFNMVIINNDPSSAAGRQNVLLTGCNLDSTVLAMLDADSDDPMEEDTDFTFGDYQYFDEFNEVRQ